MKTRTGYSFRTASGKIQEVIDVLAEQQWPAAPISDRASTFGFCQWRKASAAAGLRPIYGVELAVTDNYNAKKVATDHWAFFAHETISTINELVKTATASFRYEPLLTYDQAMSTRGMTVVCGRRPLFEELIAGVGSGGVLPFFPLSPSTSVGALRRALQIGMPLLLSNDNQYPRAAGAKLYNAICGRNAATQTWPQHIFSIDELHERALRLTGKPEADAARENLLTEMQKCQAQLVNGEMLKPEKPETLEAMCISGAQKLGVNLDDPVYKERLQRELSLIHEKQFEDYFHIIADAVQWARQRMLVGPARGSSCGSLVCYLLHITTVDPIPYGLIFERFIDVNRNDLPDIDIDFADHSREDVFEYMREKYGSNRIARLGTSATYKPRSAINEACAALGIPAWEAQALLDSIVVRSSGDSRSLNTIEDTFRETVPGREFVAKYPLAEIAIEMEGHPRHYGQHAAGIVVTDRPVNEYVAIDSRSGAAMCDKKDAEELNLLKIDALGLTQLAVLQDVLERTGRPLDFFEKLPLDDPAAYEVINQKKYAGIFQFNGIALKSVAKQIRFENIEDIISVTALARPGPLASGGTTEWIRRKTGAAPVSYPHPLFEPYLKNSMGIVIYQEQVMEIGRHVGDLSWANVTALRKAMSKSLGKEYFDQFGDRWKAGARKKGIQEEVLSKIWDDLCAYGNWSFNRSHSVAYALISYWCAWAKAHHPYEFAAATLTHEGNPDNKQLLLRELEAEGIGYTPVNPQLSTRRWEVAEIDGVKSLLGPLSGIKGMGPKLLAQLLDIRKQRGQMTGKLLKLLQDPKTDIDTIWPITDNFRRLLPDPRAKNIFTPPARVCDIEPNGEEQELVVFVLIKKIAPRDENEEVNVARRGYRLRGLHRKLNLRIADDHGEMFAMVSRYDYERLGLPIIERGGVNKSLYAFKGVLLRDYKMLIVKQSKYIGQIES